MLSFRGHPKPRARRALIAAVVAAVILTGCAAAEKLSPKLAVQEAAKATVSQKEGSFKLSLVGSEEDLNVLFNGGAPLTEEDRQGLNLLRNGHIVVSTGDDKFGLDIKAGDLEHAFELRYVDKKLYARADVAGLAKLFGGSPDEINQTVQALASQEGLEFLAAAAAGKWLEADFSTLNGVFENLFKGLQEATGGSFPEPEGAKPTENDYTAIKDAFSKAFSEDVSIEKLKSDSVGDHYLATVSSLRSFYAKVTPVVQQYMNRFPSPEQFPAASDIPDKPGSLDVWVKSGRVSRVELDLAQFAPAPPAGAGRVALRLDIDREAASVTVPSDAVPVDIAGLVQRFFSQFGQFLEGVGGGLSSYD